MYESECETMKCRYASAPGHHPLPALLKNQPLKKRNCPTVLCRARKWGGARSLMRMSAGGSYSTKVAETPRLRCPLRPESNRVSRRCLVLPYGLVAMDGAKLWDPVERFSAPLFRKPPTPSHGHTAMRGAPLRQRLRAAVAGEVEL